MRFIVDENLGLSYAQRLRDMGYDAVHVCEVGLGETDDQIIVEYAQSKGLIIITFDWISRASWLWANSNSLQSSPSDWGKSPRIFFKKPFKIASLVWRKH